MVVEVLLGVLGVGVVWVAAGFRVVRQYERAVVFRLGQVQPAVRGPGLTRITPLIDRMRKVNMQIVTMPVPAQDGITRDNVTVRVDAVVYFRVDRADHRGRGRAGLPLRHRAGRPDLAAEHHRQERPGRPAVQPGEPEQGPGAADRQSRVELGDPHRSSRDQGRRAARVDEALDVTAGRGGAGAARTHHHRGRRVPGVAQAVPGGSAMSATPAALQLRLLQTVVEVAAEKNSTLVLPFPVELLRFLEAATPGSAGGAAAPRPAASDPAATDALDPGLLDPDHSIPACSIPPFRSHPVRSHPVRSRLVRSRPSDPGSSDPGRPIPARSIWGRSIRVARRRLRTWGRTRGLRPASRIQLDRDRDRVRIGGVRPDVEPVRSRRDRPGTGRHPARQPLQRHVEDHRHPLARRRLHPGEARPGSRSPAGRVA